MLFRVILLAACLHTATDAATTQPAAVIRQWVLELGAPEPDVREAARRNLLNLTPADLGTLRAIVAEGAANLPCQAAALYDVVRHVYLTGEQVTRSNERLSFLGLRLFQIGTLGEAPLGMTFERRLMGFPAFAAFEEGDVLISVEELPDSYLTSMASLSYVRERIPPGTLVHFRVLRDDRFVSVPITLAATPAPESQTDAAVAARQQRAEDYWEQQFAGLLEGLSM